MANKKTKVTVDENFFVQLNNELQIFKSDIGNYIAAEASRRLSTAALDATRDFYIDYEPVRYKRHYQFYKSGKSKAFKPYRNSNTLKGKYYGGIRLTPESLDDVYELDKYDVYGLVMGCVIGKDATDDPDIVDYDSIYALGGYHGPYSYLQGDPPPMRPDPITRIFEELDNIYAEQDSLIKKAVTQSTKKRNYKLLSF